MESRAIAEVLGGERSFDRQDTDPGGRIPEDIFGRIACGVYSSCGSFGRFWR